MGHHQGAAGQIHALYGPLSPHLRRAHRRHALEVRVDGRFRIEQELGRADYAVPRFDSRLDGHLVAKLGAQGDGDRLEAAIPQRQHQPVLAAGADHRFARHYQLRLSLARLNRHLDKHIGFQKLVRVVKAQPHLEGTSSGVERRVEVIDPALPAAARGVVEGHGDRIPHFELGGLALEHLGTDPHLLEGADVEQGGGGLHILALAHLELGDIAAARGIDAHRLAHLAAALEGGYLIRRYLQGLELALGGAQQQRVGGVEGEQVLVLGVDQIRGVELVNQASLADLLPLALDGEGADPACHAGVDRLQPVLVIADVAHRLDLLVDGELLHLGEPYPQVLLDLGADGDCARRAVFLLLIDGDKVHPHVVLGRAIALVAGIHGVDPVERRLLFDGGAISALFGGPVAATGAEGEQQGRHQDCLVHDWPPARICMQKVQEERAPAKAATWVGEQWAGDIIRLLLCRPPGG
ncbi:hypothetical protein D3C85_853040 [compost metagenome]